MPPRGGRGQALLDLATASSVLGSGAGRAAWSQVLRSGSIDEARRLRLARHVGNRLRDMGRPQEAASVLAAAAAGARTAPGRAEAASASDLLTLSLGEAPADAVATVAALLEVADVALRSGKVPVAAHSAARAAEIAFHRALHFDAGDSPLAADPAGFLAPWRTSTAAMRLRRRSGRRHPAAAPGGLPPGRAHRVLFLTYRNANFLGGILDHLAARPGVETRVVDLADAPAEGTPLSPTRQVQARMTGPDDARELPWAAPLAEHLDWADTVWVEWCQRTAALVTMLDPGDARIVVRLHSHEAFTVFPHLMDWSRVDDLVFVAGHLRELVLAAVPQIAVSTRTHVLPNALHLDRFGPDAAGPKGDDARFTLGLVGVDAVAKDPLWAVELLARLRASDPRYRLVLVGKPMAGEGGRAGAGRYAAALRERLAAPDVAGAVDQLGPRDDVPQVLRSVGVMLSSSTRESFHLAVIEGAASGAVPVVRDWPLLTAYGGPRTLFPAEWVVADVDAAAARVLAATATPQAWAAAGAQAAEQARERFDWSRVAPRYDTLLFEPGAS